MFTKLLLVACVCIILVLVIYFFYWNRLIAFVIGQIIRVVYWNQEASSIWVEIGSIHFSLPAGRILFKDFRYHSSNQTIKVVKGQLQWRYWIRRPTAEEEITTNRDGKDSGRWLSCRIHVSLQGFEWFLYNRTAAFDNIVSQMEPLDRTTSRFSEQHRTKSRQDAASTYPPTTPGKQLFPIPLALKNAFRWLRRQLPSLDPKDLLPLGIEVSTGAIILGNASTPKLLVAEFHTAGGTFSVVSSRSKYDLYKQNLNLKFQNALIRYVENEDRVESMVALGAILHDRIQRYNANRAPNSYVSYKSFSRLWRQVRLFELVLQYFSERREQLVFQKSLAEAAGPKNAKNKKLEDEETPIGIDFSTHEYAVEQKILEAPSLELTYFVDVVGEVPPLPHSDPFSRGDIIDVGNGDTAPEWGINLVIKSGFLRYGPWADRQRVELQRAFFPPSYQDLQVTTHLNPGDKRVWTALHVFIELRDETTLHIPFREASKDWQWDGKTNVPRPSKTRESASINLTVGDRSSINYIMPMAIGSQGYEPIAEIHLDTFSLRSSLNDIRLITAESCRIRCEQPSPLRWNGVRTWSYSITLRQPILYLLRDHINMFTDLAKDWISGPPTDYQKFIPMIYVVKLRLHHYEINLYANDHNIIDKPLIREDNALLTFRGVDLNTKVTVPSYKFRPATLAVPFTVEAPNVAVDLSVPRWSTHALNTPCGGYSLLKSEGLHLAGSYRYYSEVHEENVDQLTLDFQLHHTAFKALGWAIRYIMVLKDNYFGSFTHFSTLSEYLGKRQSRVPLGDPIKLKYREGKHNMLQVELSLDVDQGLVVGPAGLLGHRTSSFNAIGPTVDEHSDASGSALMLSFPRLQVYLRLHDYFMEMSLNIDTIRGRINAAVPEKMDYKVGNRSSKEVLCIDSIDIVANRLFGPLPSTSTYLCIWEIRIGTVKAFLSAFEAKVISAVGTAFGIHFTDVVNAPAEDFAPPIDPDITFYKIAVGPVEMVWKTPAAALVVSLDHGIKFNSNDLASNLYRKVTMLRIPRINVKVLVTASTRGTSWLEAGEINGDAFIDIYDAPKDYQALNKAQTDYVQEQDKPTGRVRRMVAELAERGTRSGAMPMEDFNTHEGGMFLPQPLLPNADLAPKVRPLGKARTRSHSRKTSSWRLARLGSLSDSDGDDALSEADRDAFVAKTRLSISKSTRPENEEDAMSTGDESDDADLTDGDSLNSDWSDIADSPNATSESSMLSFYSPLTRHYYQNQAGLPGTWSGSAFLLARDKSPLKGQHKPVVLESKPFSSFPIGLADDSKKECDTTIFRVRTKRPWEVKLTPLVVVASTSFEEDVSRIPSDPEMLVDNMMASYLPSLLKEGKTSQFTLLDLGLPALGITLFHHISPGTDPDFYHSPLKLDSTAVLELSLNGTHLSLGKLGKEMAFRGAIGQVACNIGISLDKRTLISSAPALTIFDTTLLNLSLEMSDRNLVCEIQDIQGTIGHRGPGVIVAAATSLVESTSPVVQALLNLKKDKEASLRNSIHGILSNSQGNSIVDTLSTIQPSYLVQAGVPWRLRSDIGFRLLFHLRSCIGTPASSTTEPAGIDTFISLLDTRLSTLEQDAVHAWQHPRLLKILPEVGHIAAGPRAKGSKSLMSVALNLNQVGLTVLDSLGRVATELRVTDVQIAARKDKLELIQFSSSQPTSMSQTSLRERVPRSVRRYGISISLGDINLAVYPQLMAFVQEVLRIQTQHLSKPSKPRDLPKDMHNTKPPKSSNFSIVCSLQRLRVRTAAENLLFELGLVGLKLTSTVQLSQPNTESSANHALLFSEIYLQARSPSSPDKETFHDILAAVAFQNGKISYLSKTSTALPKLSHRLIFSIEQFKINVPRSAMRLYRFAEEWRADYLPGFESTLKAMLSEIDNKPVKQRTPSIQSKTSRDANVHVAGSLDRISLILQVMHGTWVTWEVEKIVAYAKSPSKNSVVSSTYTFGIQLAAVTLNISSSKSQDPTTNSRVRLVLPPLSVAGHYDGSRIHTLILVEFIELKVKPSHWDTLLAVQQKFGQDFNDFLSLVQETRENRPEPSAESNPRRSMQYGAFIKMKGFRVGLEGLSSTLYLECVDIRGGINNSNGLAWDIGLTGLALSLAPRALGGLPYNRHQRSAFVSIDFKITGNDNNSNETLVQTLDISVTKIHAVMQASSIGEIGDFVDHLQAEMLDRREQRAVELAEFKEKTQSLLKTFEVKVGEVQLEETTGWLGGYIVNVSIQNVGVAFPLTHDHEFGVGRTSRDTEAIRAFLFSIKSITFKTDRGETGEALMEKLCFQFVPRFRQSAPEDFAADRHHARNCLVYPEMRAQLRSSTAANSRKLWIDANVDGFILDLDSGVPDYVFSLIDVYRKGKERVERLSSSIPRTPSSSTPLIDVSKSFDRHYTAIPTSNVFASLRFSSGKVRAYSGSAVRQFRSRSLSLSTPSQDLTDEQVLDMGAEVFNLPTLSVWAEYRATPASQKLNESVDPEHVAPSLLMFKSTVHSSRNVLRPKLLPFLTEVIDRVETRMRKISSMSPATPGRETPASFEAPQQKPFSPDSDAVSSLQLSFSLRIDQSRLELTCHPDVNVVAAVNWESGGFTLNVSPGARNVSFTGAVGGLSIGLKHGFLSEDCLNVDARNLTFSISFTKMDTYTGRGVNTISAILETELLGGVRFSRLQDILCFKAVWLDRIPMWNTYTPAEGSNVPQTVITPVSPDPLSSQDLSTVILVRIRQIKVSVDLGQSISFPVLDLKNAVLRSKLTDEMQELSVFVEDVSIAATGNLSGRVRVPDCLFQTIRRSERYVLQDGKEKQTLELKMTSGPLIAILESDHQRLLHYRAEPLEVEIFDDWTITAHPLEENRPLQLSFVVSCPEIAMVATISTIPQMMSYINKFNGNLEAQRQGASRESKTYWATRTPKPDNPLSAVAEAMLHSARSRFKEMETGLEYVIRQHMSLRLDLLRLVVFPRSMNDVEIAQFVGQKVSAQFDRIAGSTTMPVKRDLRLSFSSMTISKHTQNHPTAAPAPPMELFDGREWLEEMFRDATEATIVGLPSMNMHMISEEEEEEVRVLTYDFKSRFIRTEGMKAYEDIFITLNMSLYTWLTLIRKNLTREMEQARATEDWRATMNVTFPGPGVNTSTNAGYTRKKAPEPLDLSQHDMTSAPADQSIAVSPLAVPVPASAPTTARYPSINQATDVQVLQAPRSATLTTKDAAASTSAISFPASSTRETTTETPLPSTSTKRSSLIYKPRSRHIERLTMRQLGEATPDVMHPFFMKKAGFNLEDSLPQYLHEYAAISLEEIMEVLLKIYSQQLLKKHTDTMSLPPDSPAP